jgi:hypothetical protein
MKAWLFYFEVTGYLAVCLGDYNELCQLSVYVFLIVDIFLL